MKKILVLLILIQFFLTTHQQAHAQTFNFTVSPSVVEIKSYSTSTANQSILIINSSNQDMRLSYSFIPLKQSMDGKGQLIPTQTSKDYQALFKNISLSQNGNSFNTLLLPALSSQRIDLSLKISKEMKQKDYYFTIAFAPNPLRLDDQSTTSSIQPQVGILIMVQHQYPQKPLIITSLNTPSFIRHGPVQLGFKVLNNSSSLDSYTGSVVIYDMFGQKVANLPVSRAFLFAGSSRWAQSSSSNLSSTDLNWPQHFLLGSYTAHIQITNDAGQQTNVEAKFTALPVKYFIIITAILALIMATALKVYKKI